MKRSRRNQIKIVSGLVLASLTIVIMSQSTFATSSVIEGLQAAHGDGQPMELFGMSGVFTTISNVLLFVVGVLSVVMVIVGGLRYVISGGNATAVAAAKNTVLYAIVGVVVAFLAYAIINFVLGNLMPGSSGFTNV